MPAQHKPPPQHAPSKPQASPVKSGVSWWQRANAGAELETFLDTLSILVDSGMGVVPALDAIGEELHAVVLRSAITRMRNDIESGLPFWRALETSHLVSDQTIALLRLGEESGQLPQNLTVVVGQHRKEREFQSKVRSALIYPSLVFSLTLTIGLGIAWFLLPKLATVFSQLHLKLPLITRAMIAIGAFLSHYGIVAVPVGLVVLVSLVILVFIYPPTKGIGEAILMHVSLTRQLIQEVEIARLGFILGTLLDAGIPIEQALTSLAGTSGYRRYQRFYQFLQKQLVDGKSFRESFHEYRLTSRIIPISVQQMVAAGEQSGRLAPTLVKLGEIYDNKTELTTKNLATALEPILLVTIWIGVLLLAISVILPIYSLIGNLNNSIQ